MKFAPLRPGAKPTIRSSAVVGPNVGTGALNFSGKFSRFSSRNATRRGHSAQFFVGIFEAEFMVEI